VKGKKTRFHGHVTHIDSFDRFFEAAIKTKRDLNVHNSAMAIAVMAELALERLAQIEAENDSETDEEPNETLDRFDTPQGAGEKTGKQTAKP